MVKFIICSDSDIPRGDIEKYGIDLLPLIVELDGVEYRAYRDISGGEFRELLHKSKSFPKTATVSSVEIADKIRVHIENGNEVIMVTTSSKGSGTFNSARLAIVPILSVNDGMLEPIGKERGTRRAIEAIVRIMEERRPSKRLGRVQLVQCNREKEAGLIEGLIKDRFVVEELLPWTNPEASVTAHSGMDFIGIAFAEADSIGGVQ